MAERYYSANIPLDFWDKDINLFVGDQKLVTIYNDINSNFKTSYQNGKALFLKGQHGVGKTFFSSLILKRAVEKGYSGLYTTLGDVVSVLVYGDRETKFNAGRELKLIDWLVIDEVDSRFVGSDDSADLFGRILESIIRIRLQNFMPVIMITNDTDITKSIGSKLGVSLQSLINGYMQNVPVIGADFRKNKGVNG